MIAVTFTVFEWEISRGSNLEVARTAAVNMLVFSELIYLFNVRHLTASGFTGDTLAGNPVALWMGALLIGFQLLLTYTAPMQQIFQTAALDAQSWLMILALGSALFVAVEAKKALLRRLHIRNI